VYSSGKANEVRAYACHAARGAEARQLCELWTQKVNSATGPARLDGLDGLGRTTLDIMGLAGFGYAFNSLSRSDGNRSALESAFRIVFEALQISAESLIGVVIGPAFEHVPTARNRRIAEARRTMNNIGLQLLEERRAAVVCVFLSGFGTLC
jgi:hypothetical protein